jgi:hypothetical protein
MAGIHVLLAVRQEEDVDGERRDATGKKCSSLAGTIARAGVSLRTQSAGKLCWKLRGCSGGDRHKPTGG